MSTVPGPPQNVRVSGTSSRSISVAWDPPVFPNGVLLEYVVTWRSVDLGNLVTITTPATNYTFSGLLPCTTYTFSISATTSKGSGSSVDTIGTTQAVGEYFLNVVIYVDI